MLNNYILHVQIFIKQKAIEAFGDKSLSEKWLPDVTFTMSNMQNRDGYADIIDLL